jgi:hypothetical protein
VFDDRHIDFSPGAGSYTMSVTTADSVLPANWWEAYWKVEEMYDAGMPTGVYYEGAYGTTISWEYAVASVEPELMPTRRLTVFDDTWTLVVAEGLVSTADLS